MTDYAHKGLVRWTPPPGGNPLRHILAWLKGQGLRPRFGHADPRTTLLPQLSLRENLLLALEEGEIAGPDAERDALLRGELERQGLAALMHWVPNWDRRPTELSPLELTIAAICHALLRDTPLTLIELPDVPFETLQLAQLKAALQSKGGERHILLVLGNESGWEELGSFNPQRSFAAQAS